MITITPNELQIIKEDTRQRIKKEGLSRLRDLRSGRLEGGDVLHSLCISLYTLREYKVQKFTPESYYNLSGADYAFRVYSKNNTK